MQIQKLLLVEPTAEMRDEVSDYIREHFAFGEHELHGSALLETMEYTLWLKQWENNRRRETVNPKWMRSETFFVRRASDQRIVGMVDIRLELNDFGRQFAGNIGYGVRPTERRKGYATEILRIALAYAARHDIDPAMVCCYKDNVGSVRTIERCGGELQRTFTHDGRIVHVYNVPTRRADA